MCGSLNDFNRSFISLINFCFSITNQKQCVLYTKKLGQPYTELSLNHCFVHWLDFSNQTAWNRCDKLPPKSMQFMCAFFFNIVSFFEAGGVKILSRSNWHLKHLFKNQSEWLPPFPNQTKWTSFQLVKFQWNS